MFASGWRVCGSVPQRLPTHILFPAGMEEAGINPMRCRSSYFIPCGRGGGVGGLETAFVVAF